MNYSHLTWILQMTNYIGFLSFIGEYQSLIGSLLIWKIVSINYVRKWTSQLWKAEEFHVWSMAGHMLRHYWNNDYNTFLEIHWDVCNFAKLVDLHFRQRMNLEFVTSLLLFWSTFWPMDKVTKFSPWPFLLVSKVTEAEIMWSGGFLKI